MNLFHYFDFKKTDNFNIHRLKPENREKFIVFNQIKWIEKNIFHRDNNFFKKYFIDDKYKRI